MKGIDTNILIRFLTGDDKGQAEKVYTIFKQAEAEKDELFVPLLVLLEMIWVLDSVYGITRAAILESIGELLLMPILKFEQRAVLQQFVHAAPKDPSELPDLLIAYTARAQGCETVITFDKRACRSDLFELAGRRRL